MAPSEHKQTHDYRRQSVAFLYGARASEGGLGHAVAAALTSLSEEARAVQAFGPGAGSRWSLPHTPTAVQWTVSPDCSASGFARRTWLRRRQGAQVLAHDKRLGAWAMPLIRNARPDLLYAFTQVGCEALEWAKKAGVPTVLENPNGHIKDFARVLEEESETLCGQPFRGHPNHSMIERVEREYELAGRIRVYSQFARDRMIAFGVSPEKIFVEAHPIDIERFRPPAKPARREGPLRLCYVGSLCLRKGFYYLLGALRKLGPSVATLNVAGATGDRCSARLFERERAGLPVIAAPGDPLPVYQQSEVLVLPTLEDGFGFVAAEAMACGLPVIVTKDCGAAEWVSQGRSGWIVPSRNEDALAQAIADAFTNRQHLPEMGRCALAETRARVRSLLHPARQANA